MNVEQTERGVDLSAGFQLGAWQVAPLTNTLHRAGHPSHIEPKVMDVLLCLARNQGEVVSRDQLLSEVWEGLVVTEEVLTRCISELRTALGDTNRQREYIRTVPKRGYVLIMALQGLEDLTAAAVVNSSAVVVEAGPLKGVTPTSVGTEPGTDAGTDVGTAKAAVSETFQLLRMTVSTLGKLAVTAVVMIALVVVIVAAIAMLSGEELDFDNLRVSFAGNGDALEVSGLVSGAGVVAKNVLLPTVAVLPFVNLSGNPELAYFSSGLTEDIRNLLINTEGIRVAARTSSEVFRDVAVDVREIGQQLNVETLVEGTVRLDGDRLRLSVQLTDVSTGYPLWSERYEQNFDNVFTIQDQVAKSVVAQLAPTIKPAVASESAISSDVLAYDYYLLGRHHWNLRTAESIDKAVDYFQRALARDENYALAYSGLADALILQMDYVDMKDHSESNHQAVATQAQHYVDLAMALNADLAEVHASQGLIYWETRHVDLARSSYQRAVEINPHYSMARMWLGNILLGLGEVAEAYKHYQVAISVDPLHPVIQANYLQAKLLMGRYQQVNDDGWRFYQQNHAEGILKIQMYAKMMAGQYDEVLNFAVRHNFSKHYASYTSQFLVEALIYLERYGEVATLIEQNPGQLSAIDLSRLRALLALATRQADALLLAATPLQASDDVCDQQLGHQFAAQAQVLKEDYPEANRLFANSFAKPTKSMHCRARDASILSIYAYAGYADSLRRAGNTEAAQEMLAAGKKQWRLLAASGRAGADIVFGHASLALVEGDYQRSGELIQGMRERGWQPYAMMSIAPLFDGQQQRLFTDPQVLSRMTTAFAQMQQRSQAVTLSKFGI